VEQLEPWKVGCSLASLARLFHLAAIRPDKSRGQGFLRAGTYGVLGGAVNCGAEASQGNRVNEYVTNG
jgi:hypothetical protein